MERDFPDYISYFYQLKKILDDLENTEFLIQDLNNQKKSPLLLNIPQVKDLVKILESQLKVLLPIMERDLPAYYKNEMSLLNIALEVAGEEALSTEFFKKVKDFETQLNPVNFWILNKTAVKKAKETLAIITVALGELQEPRAEVF